MFGFFVFESLLINVGEKCQNKILGNIFGLTSVSVSKLIIKENEVVFRLFSNGVFYHYLFVVGVGENKLECDDRIVNCKVFLGGDKNFNEFIWQLAQCWNEYQVYQLVCQIL